MKENGLITILMEESILMKVENLKKHKKIRMTKAKKVTMFTFLVINLSMKVAGSTTKDMVQAR